MLTKPRFPRPSQQRYLDLPSPADVCRTPLSTKIRLQYAEDLDDSEWNEQPTRPLRPDAMREDSK